MIKNAAMFSIIGFMSPDFLEIKVRIIVKVVI